MKKVISRTDPGQQFIVRRSSEFTFALINTTVRDDNDFLERVSRAVTRWVRTEEGKEWYHNETRMDANIGDLASYWYK